MWRIVSSCALGILSINVCIPAQANDSLTAIDATNNTVVTACDDDSWPPYVFKNKQADGTKVDGFSVEVIREALALSGKTLQLSLLPWLRCQQALQNGLEYQLILGASYTNKRAEHFLLTNPYHTIGAELFYLHSGWPNGLNPKHPIDLANAGVCAMRGFPVKNVQLDPSYVDTGHDNIQQLVQKLYLGRCKVVLSGTEAINSLVKELSSRTQKEKLRRLPMPWSPKTSYHALINSHHPQAIALKTQLDEALRSMEDSGRLNQIRQKWGLPKISSSIPYGTQKSKKM